MAGTGIMAGIYSSPSASPYPIEKVGDSPYPYPYPYPYLYPYPYSYPYPYQSMRGFPSKRETGSDNIHGTGLFATSRYKVYILVRNYEKICND